MSSKRHQRRKACEGKRRYETSAQAGYAAHLLREKDGAWMQAYHCQFCGGYHVGHMNRRRIQGLKAAIKSK